MGVRRRDLVASALLSLAAPIAGQARAKPRASADPLGVRADFPIVEQDLAFLNSAFITPIPKPVAEAGASFFREKAERPLRYKDLLRLADQVREKFGRLINASADEVALLFSTGEGENIIANGLDLKSGDNVVIDALHYETEFVLYRQMERTHGITLRVVDHRDGAVRLDDYARMVDQRTRLVSVAWISHQNGFRHDMRPLADLAHAHGAWLHTDAIQAVGAVPVDVAAAGVDSLSANSYKWLMAGYGAAPFFVRRDRLDQIRLDRYGAKHARAEHPDGTFEIDATARRFDYSSRAFGDLRALDASLDFHQRIGVERVEAHTVGLARRLQDGLLAQGHRLFTPPGNRSAIVTAYGARPMDTLKVAFTRAKVDVTVRDDKIRISPAMFNVEADIDRCLDVMKGLV